MPRIIDVMGKSIAGGLRNGPDDRFWPLAASTITSTHYAYLWIPYRPRCTVLLITKRHNSTKLPFSRVISLLGYWSWPAAVSNDSELRTLILNRHL
ncbi:hypothetical protein ALP37_200185 [Pseudomonas amygdali pv. sesami]|nr:hypothetical protein ALP37_200185 [Pseudomonas amygdali pv. sesami]